MHPKHLSALFLIVFVTLSFAGVPLPLDLTANTDRGGPGDVLIADGVISLTPRENATKAYYTTLKCPSQGTGFYVFRGQFKATSADGSGSVQVIPRGEKGNWLFDCRTPKIKDDTWQDFSIRFYVEESAKSFDVNLHATTGAVAFRYLAFEKADPAVDIPENAPDMEFWINMDYNDNVRYCYNIRDVEIYDEDAIARYFKLCKEHGVTGVLWRVSAIGQMVYHTKVGTRYPSFQKNGLTDYEQTVKELMERFDPPEVAVREARKNGIKIYIWMTLCDEAFNDPERGKRSYSQFLEEHPECKLLNRQGQPLEGTISYSELAAREYRLALIKELLAYGADGIYLCNRTHSNTFGVDKDADYGFNPTVVAEYKKRYGIDILTEDYDADKFKALKAEGYNQLIHDAAELIHAAGQKLMLGVSFWGVSTGRIGGNYGRMSVDIRRYIQEGWVDSIVSGQNIVGPYFAAQQISVFRQYARPDQKFYFWSQMVDYAGSRVFPIEDLIKQNQFFKFYGANGAMFHESINFEEHDAPQKYLEPIAEFFRKY